MSPEKEHLAPLGTMFWFRVEAMKRLLNFGWKYSDFPQEPNKTDGTLLHAVERVYPFVVQAAGFYPALLMSDVFARIEVTNLSHYVRSYNHVLTEHGIYNYQYKMCGYMKEVLDRSSHYEDIIRQCEREKEYWKRMAEELYPKTSIKWQICDRLSRIFFRKRGKK